MTYEREAERPDQTYKLGGELSMNELRAYRAICERTGKGLISPQNLYKTIYGDLEDPTSHQIYNSISVLVGRIKAKLGTEAIINIPGQGYMSRRIYIELTFGRRRESRPRRRS